MLRYAILLTFLISGSICQTTRSPRIAIVGAGASGIAAASKLLENGFQDLVILEAEGRIGGRVHTVPFAGYMIDMGAQWIHGEKGNVVYSMVAPLNITDHFGPYEEQWYTSSGVLLDSVLAKNLSERYMDDFTAMEENRWDGDCHKSVGECFEEIFKTHMSRIPEINETLQDQILWHFNLVETSYDASDSWYDLPVDGDDGYQVCEGDRAINWKERGYGIILDILMKRFPNPEEELPVLNKTHLNAEVAKVDYSSEDGTVKLTTQDGKEYTADHVIMTPSLGVLKADYETLFNPQLPESKIKNIKSLGFGNAAKIYLAFNDTWFNPAGDKIGGFSMLWSEEDRKRLDSNPKTRWVPYVLGAYFVEHKPRLLMFWISGKGARLMDDLTDEEVSDQAVQLLQDFLSRDYNISTPTAMIRTTWHQNKHFRGTYSFRSTETVKTNSSAAQLSEPIMKMGKPVILFGGEASNKQHFSTVHGAIGSGWREAERLINLYSKNSDAAEKDTE